MNELVSIVIPIYNMGGSIEGCLKSVMAQDYTNIEIILVDDGSKDNSLEVCKNIALSDKRIKVIHTENRGSGPARNTGIDNASGKYVYFPDADDYIEPNSVSVLVNAMEQGDYDVVVFGFKNVNPKGETVAEKTYEDESFNAEDLRQNYSECMGYMGKWGIQGAPWNKFFRMSLIKENKIGYPPLRRHQDEGFIGRYMCYARKVRFIPNVLYTYYTNDLKKEWDKYPLDYIDAVMGLYKVRQETILKWNEADIATHDMITYEYLCNAIKAAELSFSRKAGLKNSKSRKARIKEITEKAKIEDLVLPNDKSHKYQRTVYKYIKAKNISAVYMIMKAKVMLEKNIPKVLGLIKR